MKKIILLFSISILLFACGSSKQDSAAKKAQPANPSVYASSITSAELKDMLYIYASDEFEGRETGKPGQKKAIEYIKQHYVDLGIPAAKKDGNYFQDVPLEIMDVPTASMTINGKTLNYVDDFVSLSSSNSVDITATEIVNAGFGIETENYSSYKDLDINGKIVYIQSGEPKNDDGTYVISGTEETSKWSNMRQQFASKRDIAKEKGAKVVLFSYPEIYTMAASRFGKANGRMSLSGKSENMLFFIVNTTISDAINLNENNAKIVPANVTIQYESKSKKFSSENVAAYIKGSEKPDEIIVISAHLDHEGIKNGKIYNGADDDGSGTVSVIEIAEAFKLATKDGYAPKRSVLFLHVTGEEKGLLGSKHYTDNDPIFPLVNTVANLNIDMIGRTDPKRESTNRNYVYLIGSDKLSTELHDVSEAANTKYMNIELDYTFNDDNDPNRFYYRSDHYNFAKNNIPVIFYFNGTHDDYHQPSDTPDKIQYDLLENRTRLIFYTAWELANREQRVIVDKATE